MRIVICDQHVIFAESLGHALTLGGADVVAVTHRLADAVAVLAEKPADLCLVDPVFRDAVDSVGLAAVRRVAAAAAIVFLTGRLDRDVRAAAAAAGVRAIADKRQSMHDVVNLLDRVHAGEPVVDPALGDTEPATLPPIENDTQRLATFLTRRERQVLSALVRGDDTAKLARSLSISATTVRCHVQSVLTKMGAHSRLEVATTAVRAGVVSPRTGEWVTALTSEPVRSAVRKPPADVRSGGQTRQRDTSRPRHLLPRPAGA